MIIPTILVTLFLVDYSFGQNYNSDSCFCQCLCPDSFQGGGTSCPVCPPPSVNGSNPTPPSSGGSYGECESAILLADTFFGRNPLAILGITLSYLLSNLVVPVLAIVLAGNNTVEGAVIPLSNVLCTLVGLILELLKSLGLLGVLGQNSLLSDLLQNLTG